MFVGDVFTGTLNNMPGRSVTAIPTLVRRYLTFSPDGLNLAFTDTTGTQIRSMNVNANRNSRPVSEEVDPTFPISWSLDSREIAFTVLTENTDENGAPIYELRAAPAGGGEARIVGSFAFGGSCPPVITDPADLPYYAEAGPNGQDNLLVWLPNDQFLISTHCTSGIGILNLADGQVVALGDDLHGGAVSPDRARLLTHTANGLVIVDLATGQRIELAETADALQVAWAANGQAVYYSTAEPANSLTLDAPTDQERGQSVFGFWPVRTGTYTVSLVQVNLANGQKALLWQGQGRGIGRIAPAPDTSGVLFSLITSGERLAQSFQAGDAPHVLREVQPGPVLYWLPAGGSTARLLSYSGQPAFAPITVEVTTDPPQQ
jgi:WD40 repeat protein